MPAATALAEGGPSPIETGEIENDAAWKRIIGTCHVWDPDGQAVAARQAQLFEAIPGTGRAYLNFQDAPCGADAAFDGETLARLRAVRDAVDPNRRIVTKHPLG